MPGSAFLSFPPCRLTARRSTSSTAPWSGTASSASCRPSAGKRRERGRPDGDPVAEVALDRRRPGEVPGRGGARRGRAGEAPGAVHAGGRGAGRRVQDDLPRPVRDGVGGGGGRAGGARAACGGARRGGAGGD